MNRISGTILIMLIAAASIIGFAPASNAVVSNYRCDPNRPRQDVFICGSAYTHGQRDGSGRVMEKIRIESNGDNSELDGCPALTVSAALIIPSRRGVFPPSSRTVWEVNRKWICKSGGYMRDFKGMAGKKVPERAFIWVWGKQHTNFDTDEISTFEFRVN